MRKLALLPLIALIATPVQAADPATAERIKSSVGIPAGAALPGCAIGVFKDGKTVERVNVGLADVEGARAIRSDTQFYAASVSKQFTSVAIMQLVVSGKIKLSDDIRTYVPELQRYPQVVTIQMLLNMTSGIRDSLSLLGLEGYSSLSATTREQGLAGVYRQRETKFEPGTQYDYTNGGYLLLSEVVERVAKVPFETYVNDKVLKPAGMTRSFMMLGSRTRDANFAKGYVAKNGKVTSSDEIPLFGGSGGLMTTIDDLAKWDHDIDTGHKVWTPEITRLMMQPGKFNNGAPALRDGRGIAYGNGVIVGPNWFHHTGGAGGFKTLYGRHPDKRMGVALLCNNGDYDPGDRADAVIAALNQGVPPISEPTFPASAIDGRYKSPNLTATYLLAAKDDSITITIERADGVTNPPVTLKRSEQGEYRGGIYRLLPDDDGRGFTLDIPRVTLHFDKVQ